MNNQFGNDVLQQNITETETIVKDLEEIISNPPSTIATINAALNIISAIASKENYVFVNPETINAETELVSAKTFDPSAISDLIPQPIKDMIGKIKNNTTIKQDIRKTFLDEINQITARLDNALAAFDAAKILSFSVAPVHILANLMVFYRLLPPIFVEIDKLGGLLSHLSPGYSDIVDNKAKFDVDATRVYRLPTKMKTGDKFANIASNLYAFVPGAIASLTYLDFKDSSQGIGLLVIDYTSWRDNPATRPVRRFKNGDYIFSCTSTARTKMHKFLMDIRNIINTDAPDIIDSYLTSIVQTGGSYASIKNSVQVWYYLQVLLKKTDELFEYFKTKLSDLKGKIISVPKQNMKDTTDYTSPLIVFLAYKMGSLNNFDVDMINYCQHIGLDTNIILAIYLAYKKEDIEQILSYYKKNYYSNLLNILRLKKLSAEKKFRLDYGIKSDSQIKMLFEKQSMWK